MRDLLVEWMMCCSPGKPGDEDWVSRVKIEHHADRELVAWLERHPEESAKEFAERVFAVAENDADALGDGQQLYMLRIYMPGEDDDKWRLRRPLRVLAKFPEQGQAAERADRSLSAAVLEVDAKNLAIDGENDLHDSALAYDRRLLDPDPHPDDGPFQPSHMRASPLCLEHKPWPDGRELTCRYPALHEGPHCTPDGRSWVL